MLKFVPLTSKAWGFGIPYGLGMMDLGPEFLMKEGILLGHAGETFGFNAITAYAKEYDFGISLVANTENQTLVWYAFDDALRTIVNYFNHTTPPTLAPSLIV